MYFHIVTEQFCFIITAVDTIYVYIIKLDTLVVYKVMCAAVN